MTLSPVPQLTGGHWGRFMGLEGAECYACWAVEEREQGWKVGVAGEAVWDAGVNRGEKVIEIRQCEETEWWVSFVWGWIGGNRESEELDSARIAWRCAGVCLSGCRCLHNTKNNLYLFVCLCLGCGCGLFGLFILQFNWPGKAAGVKGSP